MIPAKTAYATVEGDLSGKKVHMTMDPAAVRHLMTVLTSLYSDPEGTIIREYSTNARDSHIMSGQTLPIEVFTPTALSPYLRIKDYGLGLSVQEVEKVYALYGASTKRDSNEVAGMLGLGSKSALAYGETFTVIAVKDGKKAFVNVYRQEDGTGVMDIVDESDTDEPNGVEIKIPVKAYNQIKQKTEKFFRYWEKGLALVDGKDISRRDKLQEVTPGLYVDKDVPDMDYSSTQSYVTMGGVTYPVQNDYSIGRGIKRGYLSSVVVAEVPIGEIDFTPSREALMYTARTKNWLSKVNANYVATIKAVVVKEIEDAPTAKEALALRKEYAREYSFSLDDIKWQGHAFPNYSDQYKGLWKVRHRNQWNSRSQYNNYHQVQYDTLIDHGLIFDNFNIERPSPRDLERVSIYFDENNLGSVPATMYFFSGAFDTTVSVWFDDIKVIDWDDVKAIKLPPKPRSTTGKNPYGEKYDVWADSGNGYGRYDPETLSKNDKVIYFTPQDERDERMPRGSLITNLFPGYKVVRVYANRVDKMKRLFPNFKSIMEMTDDFKATLVASFTEEDKFFIGSGSWEVDRWTGRKVFIGKIDDPDIDKFIQAANDYKKHVSTINQLRLLSNKFNVSNTIDVSSKVTDPMIKYPLWDDRHIADTILYANAKYKALQSPSQGV